MKKGGLAVQQIFEKIVKMLYHREFLEFYKKVMYYGKNA